MEGYFASLGCVLLSLVIKCASVDVTLESVDSHSPFSEENGNDWSQGNRVFTKEELREYNGENVGEQ